MVEEMDLDCFCLIPENDCFCEASPLTRNLMFTPVASVSSATVAGLLLVPVPVVASH
jgi:hypothetical protein